MKKLILAGYVYCGFAVLAYVSHAFAERLDVNNEPISPIPLEMDLDARKVSLGEMLFNETRISKNKKMSCASCHDLKSGGAATGTQYSMPGVSGQTGQINIPTVYNSGFNFSQFWNGRADTLEDQIDGPLQHPDEMGMSWKGVLLELRQDKIYTDKFYAIYRSLPTEKAVKDSIATYERSLITPNAPFDQYLRGDENAITDIQKQGYSYFKKLGCASCHQGQNVGGNMHQSFGIVGNYFEDRGGEITDADLGLYTVTGDEDDKYVFRVPPLRNVEKTAPYFHDGSAETLENAVGIMAKYQLGRDLKEQESAALVAFLKSLSGELSVTSENGDAQ